METDCTNLSFRGASKLQLQSGTRNKFSLPSDCVGTSCLLGPSAQEASSHSIPYINVLAVVLVWGFCCCFVYLAQARIIQEEGT